MCIRGAEAVQWFNFNLGDFCVSFLGILFEGTPFMLIGTLIAGFVDSFVPAGTMERILPRNMGVAVGLSALLGIVFPMCECGLVPVIRRMIGKGMPVPCALTYLLAAPIVNPVTALSTIAAFRGQSPLLTASLRLVLGFIVASIVGLVVSRISLRLVLNREMHPLPSEAQAHSTPGSNHGGSSNPIKSHANFAEPLTIPEKVANAIRCGGHDFIEVAFYLVIGAAVASVFNTAVNREALAFLGSRTIFATAAMMVLAFLLSLCSTSDAFIAANFVTFPFVSKLAFMVFGPMMDAKLIFMYGLVFRRRFTFSLTVGLFVLVAVICLAFGTITR